MYLFTSMPVTPLVSRPLMSTKFELSSFEKYISEGLFYCLVQYHFASKLCNACTRVFKKLLFPFQKLVNAYGVTQIL